MSKLVKFVTAIYSDLYGTELGGRPNRYSHYRWSLLSLLKMCDADFICYTSEREYESLCNFFYNEFNIDKNKLTIVVYDIKNTKYKELIKKYKDVESTKKGDRCVEIQFMKFDWLLMEDGSYDYYFWIDSGLSHCGLIPNRYLSLSGDNNRGYYESELFNNDFLYNLIKNTENKVTIIAKENDRNFWSQTVDPKHYTKYDRSYHVIGGLFGGKKDVCLDYCKLFDEYVERICESDGKLYFEEHIMSVIYRNKEDIFKVYDFDIWWHEDERIPNFDIIEHTTKNKSFYKILEELNGNGLYKKLKTDKQNKTNKIFEK